MKVLIKKGWIHEQDGSANTQADIFIENGVIGAIGKDLAVDADEVLDQEGVHVSAGWFDPFVNFCEPGNEHKEDLASGSQAALAGGFTDVGIVPDTAPIIDSRPQLDFIARNTEEYRLQLWVAPSFVKEGNPSELSEILELSEAGAIAFNQPQLSSLPDSVILKALDYVKITGKKVCLSATDHSIIPGAFVHEGLVNVQIGLRGIPAFSEELQVKKYVELLRYTNSHMHIRGVSSLKALDVIRSAKADGLHLSCDTTVYHLLYTDAALLSFDTNFKLSSPLRSEQDRVALVEAVQSGLIDAVTCAHEPHEEDSKKTEIKMAENGVIGLQTMYPLLAKAVGIECALDILVNRNRKVFGLEVPTLREGEKARLTVFQPETSWILNAETNRSKSSNSMLWEQSLEGKSVATVFESKLTRV